MNRQPYTEYKPSGVEWLGEIPEHWQTRRLKHCVSLVNDKVDGSASELPYTGLEHIVSWTGKRVQADERPESEGQASKYRSGDLLFGKLRPYLAKVFRADEEGVCTGELLVLRPKNVERDFLFGYMLARDFIAIVDSSTYGAKMPRASWDFIGNLPTLIPSAEEQRAIAAFLDPETGRIDGLIEKKKRQIELLQEKRAALISHAVTKGLDPNVPMKDSGIEWLGDVPENWTTVKFGRCAFFQEGPGLRNWQFTDEGVRVVCVTNITDSGIDFSNYEKFISENEYSQSYRHFTVSRGDLLLSSSGNSWGKVAEFTSDERSILNTSTIRINRNRAGMLCRPFLKWLLQAVSTREQLGLFMTGSCQPNFGPSHLARVLVPVPKNEEQFAIAEYLDNRIGRMDAVADKIRESIATLHEYRAALISAVVTGKIDVRGSTDPR